MAAVGVSKVGGRQARCFRQKVGMPPSRTRVKARVSQLSAYHDKRNRRAAVTAIYDIRMGKGVRRAV